MNKTNWLDIIRCGENSKLQFKRERINGNSLAAEFAAFANSRGGTLLFGVEDKSGEIVGLSYKEMQELSEFASNVATTICKPTIYLQTEAITVEGKNILAVEIQEGTDKPYKDKDGVIWIKQGADKRKLTENNEILRLFSESRKYYPDEDAVADTSLQDLDERKIDQYLEKTYQKKRDDFGLSFASLMRNMRLATAEGELTLAGLLFFGKDPQRFRPNFCIKAVSFFGNELGGTEYRDSRDITGTIPDMFDEAMRFLNGNLHHVQAGQSFNSVGILEISRIALEEIVQNALCHREYIRQAAIRILIFDNRVEIVSPGALPEGMTVEEMILGNTAQRNPLICSLCAKTMIYRGLGSGIIRALKEVTDIEFVSQANQFTTIIKRSSNTNIIDERDVTKSPILYINEPDYDKLYDNTPYIKVIYDKLYDSLYNKEAVCATYSDQSTMGEEAISYMMRALLYLKANANARTEDLAKEMNLTSPAARVYLRKLAEIGMITPQGGNRNRTYRLNNV